MADKPTCKYGSSCYRKNPKHLKDFFHPSSVQDSSHSDDEDVSTENKNAGKEDKLVLKKAKTEMDKHSLPPLKKRKTEGDRKNTTLDAFFSIKKEEKLSEDSTKNPAQKNDESKKLDAPSSSDLSKSLKVKGVQKSIIQRPRESLNNVLSLEDAKCKINSLYKMEMPPDFYTFWEFCHSINKKNPSKALKPIGLELVGPYDVFTKRMDVEDNIDVHLLYRYYYDPPEFMTILICNDDKQFHLGYFRDDPKELPVFVASNSASENCLISPHGENIFSAVKWYMESKCTALQSDSKILRSLIDYAKEKEISLEMTSSRMKQRQKKVVCKTFHGAGLVVPVDQNDVGYRPVPETPANLKQMFKKIVNSKTEEERNTYLEPVEEIITYIQFANDECDYGEGIELGLDMFSYGGEVLHPFVSSLLCIGYKLLQRDLYSDIVRAFLPVRTKNLML